MKTIVVILSIIMLPLAVKCQWGFNFGAGVSKKPFAKIDAFYKAKNHFITGTYMPLINKQTAYPFSIVSINYGYLVKGFQPYVGISSQGIAYGVNAWLGKIVISAGKSGNYFHVSLSASSLNIDNKLLNFTGNDYSIIGMQLLSGFSMGMHEAIQAKHWGKGHAYWDNEISWKNKYKDYDGGDLRPAYPGSKTALVAFTDGYHLTNFVTNQANIATLCFALSSKDKITFKSVAKKAFLAAAANRAAYYLSYEIIFK
jgi:hypothetical protein